LSGVRPLKKILGYCTHEYILRKEELMTIHIELEYLLALAAGILILVRPQLFNRIVAVYLIAIGVIGILGISFS
jgi:hypothetical protein